MKPEEKTDVKISKMSLEEFIMNSSNKSQKEILTARMAYDFEEQYCSKNEIVVKPSTEEMKVKLGQPVKNKLNKSSENNSYFAKEKKLYEREVKRMDAAFRKFKTQDKTKEH